MNDDPLLTRLRDLSSPALDPVTRAQVLRQAEHELGGRRRAWGVWSGWALSAVLLACEAVYVAEVIARVRVLFG